MPSATHTRAVITGTVFVWMGGSEMARRVQLKKNVSIGSSYAHYLTTVACFLVSLKLSCL